MRTNATKVISSVDTIGMWQSGEGRYEQTAKRKDEINEVHMMVALLNDADHAPSGIIDASSWAYWNSKVGRYPLSPLPTRRL